jgi:hypothetical protein
LARPSRRAPRHRVEELAAALLGRRAVDEHDELVVARIAQLEDRSPLDDEDPASPHLVALWRLAEVDGQRAVEDDENLLLSEVAVALSLRARRIAPDVCPRLGEYVREPGDGAGVVHVARNEGQLLGPKDREAHDRDITLRAWESCLRSSASRPL